MWARSPKNLHVDPWHCGCLGSCHLTRQWVCFDTGPNGAGCAYRLEAVGISLSSFRCDTLRGRSLRGGRALGTALTSFCCQARLASQAMAPGGAGPSGLL
eukprot:625203-Amphidinium_carterae.3